MVQVPTASKDALLPLVTHIEGVLEVRVTGSEELAVAASIRLLATDWVGIVANVMVCVAALTENDCVTEAAGAYEAFPGCEAIMLHCPGAESETMFPDTEQTDKVAELNVMDSPELVEAERLIVEPTICGEMASNVMFWVPANPTERNEDTSFSALYSAAM